MPASIATSRTRSYAWYLAACLVLAAFLLRSLIPIGFMPTSTDRLDSSLALAICYSGVHPAFIGNPDGAPASDATTTCPFGLYNHSFPGFSALPNVLPAATFFAALLLPTQHSPKLMRSSGPPVGSRAPPAPAQ